jgi:hypothetical protein
MMEGMENLSGFLCKFGRIVQFGQEFCGVPQSDAKAQRSRGSVPAVDMTNNRSCSRSHLSDLNQLANQLISRSFKCGYQLTDPCFPILDSGSQEHFHRTSFFFADARPCVGASVRTHLIVF